MLLIRNIFLYHLSMQKICRQRASWLSAVKPGEQVAIFIGPEGGFEDEEIAQAENCGAQAITLGRRILRTETAGMAVLAMLGYVLEE